MTWLLNSQLNKPALESLEQAARQLVRDRECISYDYDGGDHWYVCGHCEWCRFAISLGTAVFEVSTQKWRWRR